MGKRYFNCAGDRGGRRLISSFRLRSKLPGLKLRALELVSNS
jgi:hypothetical protein